MLFTSICTALLAAANYAVATPVKPQGGTPNSLNTPSDATCVNGLITPYSKTDLENMRKWFVEQSSNGTDFIRAGSWYTWTLGTTRLCIYNTSPNSTQDEYISHKAHAQCLEKVRDSCCSPTADQCRAGQTPEYSADGSEVLCRVSSETSVCK
ncbi:hypothetical protein BU23DRAFT_555592 [Bimuria novae-zelandiae CBS 107.79]|uniref:Secreted protein n=1 Tax=Bimuria novae-zelandiae CBS 107.79 TaxID=1447943 RepID=A0A6A5V3X8_9PLEO|nr:hypothetical protein BU23DRAFT_555592 [Bimuria novae-zelandiae CBS 107.79]